MFFGEPEMLLLFHQNPTLRDLLRSCWLFCLIFLTLRLKTEQKNEQTFSGGSEDVFLCKRGVEILLNVCVCCVRVTLPQSRAALHERELPSFEW